MKFYLDLREGIPENLNELLSKHEFDAIVTNNPEDKFQNVLIVDNGNILRNGKIIGEVISINNPDEMQKALELEVNPKNEILIVETGDWHIIPIENLIAKFNSLDLTLIASASTPEEIHLLGNILELGVDGCLIKTSNRYTFEELIQTSKEEVEQLELKELEIKSIERIGNGDRVCVDTCSILQSGEGLLVGSTSAVQLLVEAEVEESGFVNSRPFRVNAGVVASYVLNFDKTNYLSELEAGKSVMIVNQNGYVRKEQIARIKIERRPLILVKVAYGDRSYPVILQDAETVKLITQTGSKRVDKLQTGDIVLGHISDKARHFGMEIDEFIEER